MSSITRTITVTRKGMQHQIQVVEGTSLLPISVIVSDYDILSGSAAVAYNRQPNGTLVNQACTISENTISFTPPEGFYLKGYNKTQVRVTNNNQNLFSFVIDVWCDENITDDADVEEINSQPTLVTQLLSQIGVLTARMDAFTALPEGSTTSDAALNDIRIGYDGTEYLTPGEAVRGQAEKINEVAERAYNETLNSGGVLDGALKNGGDNNYNKFWYFPDENIGKSYNVYNGEIVDTGNQKAIISSFKYDLSVYINFVIVCSPGFLARIFVFKTDGDEYLFSYGSSSMDKFLYESEKMNDNYVKISGVESILNGMGLTVQDAYFRLEIRTPLDIYPGYITSNVALLKELYLKKNLVRNSLYENANTEERMSGKWENKVVNGATDEESSNGGNTVENENRLFLDVSVESVFRDAQLIFCDAGYEFYVSCYDNEFKWLGYLDVGKMSFSRTSVKYSISPLSYAYIKSQVGFAYGKLGMRKTENTPISTSEFTNLIVLCKKGSNGKIVSNKAYSSDMIWGKLPNERLSFGMDLNSAPVPMYRDGQLIVNGTIIAINNSDGESGNQKYNRWGLHLYEGYMRDKYSRFTILSDKHNSEGIHGKMIEIYAYVGSDHKETSYSDVRIGSDVEYHSFLFSRDILKACGLIDCRMGMRIAPTSLNSDLIKDYETVSELDSAHEPENDSINNVKGLKYINIKNAEDGYMFYDWDHNRILIKMNGKWKKFVLEDVNDFEI